MHLALAIGHALLRLSCVALLLAVACPARRPTGCRASAASAPRWARRPGCRQAGRRQARRRRSGARRRPHSHAAGRRQGRRARRPCDAGRSLEIRQPRRRRVHRRHAGRIAARRADAAARCGAVRRQPRHLPQRGDAVPRSRPAEGSAARRQAARRRRRRQLSADRRSRWRQRHAVCGRAPQPSGRAARARAVR